MSKREYEGREFIGTHNNGEGLIGLYVRTEDDDHFGCGRAKSDGRCDDCESGVTVMVMEDRLLDRCGTNFGGEGTVVATHPGRVEGTIEVEVDWGYGWHIWPGTRITTWDSEEERMKEAQL